MSGYGLGILPRCESLIFRWSHESSRVVSSGQETCLSEYRCMERQLVTQESHCWFRASVLMRSLAYTIPQRRGHYFQLVLEQALRTRTSFRQLKIYARDQIWAFGGKGGPSRLLFKAVFKLAVGLEAGSPPSHFLCLFTGYEYKLRIANCKFQFHITCFVHFDST